MSDENERHPMDGKFLGGGRLGSVIVNGEVYLNADQLATLFGNTGIQSGRAAVATKDEAGGAQALLLLHLTQQLHELTSELLRQEAEKLFKL